MAITPSTDKKKFFYLDKDSLAVSVVEAHYRQDNMWFIPELGWTCTVGYQLFENIVAVQQCAKEILDENEKKLVGMRQNYQKLI